MSDTSAEPGPPAAPPGWTPGQVALVVFAGALAATVAVRWLSWWRVLPESFGIVVIGALLVCVAVGAGLVGREQRRKEKWRAAVTAYRLAVWCLALALFFAAQYHPAVIREKEREAGELMKAKGLIEPDPRPQEP